MLGRAGQMAVAGWAGLGAKLKVAGPTTSPVPAAVEVGVSGVRAALTDPVGPLHGGRQTSGP